MIELLFFIFTQVLFQMMCLGVILSLEVEMILSNREKGG